MPLILPLLLAVLLFCLGVYGVLARRNAIHRAASSAVAVIRSGTARSTVGANTPSTVPPGSLNAIA